jgi:hypothetical protein
VGNANGFILENGDDTMLLIPEKRKGKHFRITILKIGFVH